MKKTLFLSLFSIGFWATSCQNEAQIAPPQPEPEKPYEIPDFPKDWTGTYTGKMLILFPQRIDTVPVTFELLNTDTVGVWVYRMTYEQTKTVPKMVKDYRLVHKEGAPAHQYIMDEGGGLQLRETYLDKTFYSYYSMDIQDSPMMFNSTLKKTGKDELFFEVNMASMMPVDTVYESIYNHLPAQMQKVVLKRK